MLCNHDRYFNYSELTDFLKLLQKTYPDLVHLDSLGKSTEGREMWIATVTDWRVGTASDKPAFWVDGNTHAGEVAGCQACVHLLDVLTSDFTTNKEIQDILKSLTFYVVPRISVDGAEVFLTTAQWLRSSPQIWPHPERVEGLYTEDIDQNGEILSMRLEDPAGDFKISRQDPRLLIPREPTDFGAEAGPFYRLFPEGRFQNYDGFTQILRTEQALDLNRQSPAQFEPKEYGAGPIPQFLPEARQLAEAVVARPNIFGAHTHHTFGGFLLRPSSLVADKDLPTFDLEIFQMLSQIGEKLTGYKAYGIFHDFRYDPKEVTTGSWDDWHYHHRGFFSFTPEIWSLPGQVGYTPGKPLEMYQYHSEELLVKILKWCDQNLAPQSFYQEWTRFHHPQLGPVEIGGWKRKFVWSNPPPHLLKTEVAKLTQFALAHAKFAPLVEKRAATKKKISEAQSELEVQVQNIGFLPTHVSDQAKSLRNPLKPFVKLTLEGSLKLIQGKLWQETHHLTGRSTELPYRTAIWGGSGTNSHMARFQWIVQGSGKAEVEISYQTGGVIRHSFNVD